MGTGTDQTLEAQIHPSITIERVSFTAGAYQVDIRTWSRWRAYAPELWNGYRARKDLGSFPEPGYGSWRGPIEDAAVRIHNANPVDLTIGTANPHVDFMPGDRLFRESGVPYVMDYRDAWQLNVFSGKRLSAKGGAVDRIESLLLEHATEIWFVNEPIRSWHAEQHPQLSDKMHVVANGYDQTFAQFGTEIRSGRESGLVFGYIGTISGQVPMRELFEGWVAARKRSTLLAASRIELYGYLDHSGIPNEKILELLTEYRDQGIAYRGPVGRAEIAATYHSFDGLLLVLGTGKYVTSGKVFEYTATGLPLASIHDPGNAATTVLDASPVWRGIPDLSVNAVADALLDLAAAAKSQTATERRQAQNWAEQYERSRQLKPRISSLRAKVSPSGGERQE